MGKHEAPPPTPSTTHGLARHAVGRRLQRAARHALHPITHILALVSLHIVALAVIDKSPLLAIMMIH